MIELDRHIEPWYHQPGEWRTNHGVGSNPLKLAALAAAIHLAWPPLSLPTCLGYARVIQEEAARARVDPLLVVSVAAHESHFSPSADNGQCVGLGQVCLRTQSACSDGLDTPACQARRTELLQPATNLHVVAGTLAAARKHCKAVTRHAEIQHVVAAYAGTDVPGRVVCGQVRGKHGWRSVKPHAVVSEIVSIYRRIKGAK